ncbi:hypothetical protein Zm00014a_009914 [Zea mays]|uniref:Uncharacterized protein n=1 Tax=Zea mays TaxID=4577 RepID=A0A3L6ENS5_MAIZE|nr:hypothetical protein Zm00014a_009914 [Zea mays]
MHPILSYPNFHYDANGNGKLSLVRKMFHHMQ